MKIDFIISSRLAGLDIYIQFNGLSINLIIKFFYTKVNTYTAEVINRMIEKGQKYTIFNIEAAEWVAEANKEHGIGRRPISGTNIRVELGIGI